MRKGGPPASSPADTQASRACAREAAGRRLTSRRDGGGPSADAAALITDLLARGHSVRFRAGGDSMYPIIRSDDYLLVEPASAARIRRGDVVLTLAERGLTAHRVIAVQGDTLITRGDNSDECDFPVDVDRILGRVTHVERGGRMRRVRRATSIVLKLQRVIARL